MLRYGERTARGIAGGRRGVKVEAEVKGATTASIESSERRRDLTAIVVELFSGIHEVGRDVDNMLRSMDVSVEEDTVRRMSR